MHPRNKHQGRYDLKALAKVEPKLSEYIHVNEHKVETINFFEPKAVKALNKALLLKDYNIQYWDIPEGYLCPPIPGRADYIHHLQDLFGKNQKLRCLDIGTGANCIYPILGTAEYGWKFVASEHDRTAIANAKKIISKNTSLKGKVELRAQKLTSQIFKEVIKEDESFDLTMCNPPFYVSAKEAERANKRKIRNLVPGSKEGKSSFEGQSNELWTKGGELQFLHRMISESQLYKTQVKWFTCLVSKGAHLEKSQLWLNKSEAKEVLVIEMGQGQKTSRILAWRFQ